MKKKNEIEHSLGPMINGTHGKYFDENKITHKYIYIYVTT